MRIGRLFLLAVVAFLFTWLVLVGGALCELVVVKRPDGVVEIVSKGTPTSSRFAIARRKSWASPQQSAPNPRLSRTRFYGLITAIARGYGLDPALVKAVVKVESNFDPFALSHKGAKGLMQLLPSTARRYGLRDCYDPVGNVQAGVKHLKELLVRYNYNLDLALAAYNAGPGAVDRYGGVPPFGETRRFIRRVRKAYEHFSGRRTAGRSVATVGRGAIKNVVREDGTIFIYNTPG